MQEPSSEPIHLRRTVEIRETAPAAIARGESSHRTTWVLTWLLIVVALAVVVPYLAERVQYAITRGQQRAEMEVAGQELEQLPLDQLSRAYQLVYQRVAPTVVHIRVKSVMNRGSVDELDALFGYQRPDSQSEGSGVIVDESGYIVTNNHVVAGATAIVVALSDGRSVEADVIGADALTDLAVLKIQARGLIAAEWGDSDQLEVGSIVWAVGSPFGLQSTITSGILSAKNRAAAGAGSAYQDFMQTDAAVNPGNSGGPLVDAHGRVVGINTAIVGHAYQGISFAIPSAVAKGVYDKLRNTGRVERGWLGVSLADVTDELARELSLPVSRGAYVHAVVNDPRNPSPAQRAGFRPGDIVIRWNGEDTNDSATLSQLVARTKIGTEAEVVIIRQGQPITLTVEVAERPPDVQ